MTIYQVRIGMFVEEVEANNVKDAKLKAARTHVRKYPNSNIDTHKLLTQYKVKARKIDKRKTK